jgi:hypothetical protein
MRKLLVLSSLILAPLSAPAQAPAAAQQPDEYGAAVAASLKIKAGAPGTLRQLREMPVEFAGVTKVIGYADEVGARYFAEPDASAALAHKKAYWRAHARTLGRRLATLGGDELNRQYHIHAQGERPWRARTFGDSIAGARQALMAQAEKNALIAHLGRVESVLADIEADEKGADSGQALIDRKTVLFERLAR